MTDQPTAEAQLAAARATNQHLNLRAEHAEAILARLTQSRQRWVDRADALASQRDGHARTIDRVRHAVRIADAEDATDWQRGYRACSERALTALDDQAPADTWTPPPPGDRREQLPDHLLALIRDRLPDYLSTACQTADAVACTATYPGSGVPRPLYDEIREHAEWLHERCRTNQKFTGQPCTCGCHPQADPDPGDLVGYITPEPPIRCLTLTTAPARCAPHEDSRECPRPTGCGCCKTTPAPTPEPTPDRIREQLHAAIEPEIYAYRERTTWWPETGGITEEIARLAVRGAMEIRDRELETLRSRLATAQAQVHADGIAMERLGKERGQLAATLAAITAEAARRGVISIDGIRKIVKEQR